MNADSFVRMFAGFVLLLSLALYYWVSPNWLYLSMFVALNLIQSSLTKFCPAEMFYKKLFPAKARS